MRRLRIPHFRLNVALKVAAIVIAFEVLMLVAYVILTNFFVDSQEFLNRINLSQQNFIAILLVASLVLAGYLTFLVVTRIFTPVDVLIRGTDEIIKGNLDHRVEVRTNDELQVLADRFNAMAEALRVERNSLEQKVKERTRALEQSQTKEIERQQDVLRLKDEFLFVAAHELRTPVTSIRWNLENLLEAKKMKKEDLQQTLEDVMAASKSLAILVDDLLNMARLDSKRLEFNKELVDLRATVREVLKELEPIAAKKNVVLSMEVSDAGTVDALGDSRRVREVLVNLVGNAVKYGHKGGKVVVAMKPDGGKVRLDVIDDGPGIPKEEQAHVFEKFWRSQEQTNVEGSGLGLFITKRLVEGMDGTIGFKSEPGKGATFTVLLPAK